MVPSEALRRASAEQQLKEIGINLPSPPKSFGTYVEAVRTGSLLSSCRRDERTDGRKIKRTRQ